jgi:hypothetical protein
MPSPEIDLDALSAIARPMVEELLRRKAEDPRLSVTRQECMRIDPHWQSKQILLEQEGEYQVFNEGGMKRILTGSIYDRMIRNVIASYPADAPPVKITQPKARFRKKARARTEAELRGLAQGNAKRAEEARAKREAAAREEAKI